MKLHHSPQIKFVLSKLVSLWREKTNSMQLRKICEVAAGERSERPQFSCHLGRRLQDVLLHSCPEDLPLAVLAALYDVSRSRPALTLLSKRKQQERHSEEKGLNLCRKLIEMFSHWRFLKEFCLKVPLSRPS